MLNLYDSRRVQDALSYYLFRSNGEWKEDYETGKIKIQDQPSFLLADSVIGYTSKYGEKILENQYLSRAELKENAIRGNQILLYISSWYRECELSAVKNRAQIVYHYLDKDNEKMLKKNY
jgi:hypothetical protein